MNLSTPRSNPALTTIVFVLGVVAAAALLSWVTQLGVDTDENLVESGPFRTWVAVAAFALVAFVDTLLAGFRELRSDRLRSSSLSAKVYGGLFLVFAAIVLIALRNGGKGGPPVDVQYWDAITPRTVVAGSGRGRPVGRLGLGIPRRPEQLPRQGSSAFRLRRHRRLRHLTWTT